MTLFIFNIREQKKKATDFAHMWHIWHIWGIFGVLVGSVDRVDRLDDVDCMDREKRADIVGGIVRKNVFGLPGRYFRNECLCLMCEPGGLPVRTLSREVKGE